MALDLFWVLWTPFVLLGIWVIIDFKGWSRFLRRYHQLNHEGRWDDLETLVRKELTAFRPWTRLLFRFKAPGTLDGLAAVFFFQRGLPEEALRLAERAEHTCRAHDRLLPEVMNIRALALIDLERTDDARELIGRIRALSAPLADFAEAHLTFQLGRLDHSLALAQRARLDPKGHLARHTASTVLLCKGDHRGALEILLDPPPDVTDLYRAEVLHKLERTREGRSLLEAHRKQWAGVVEPLRFLQAAHVYLDLDDIEGLRFSLEKAAAVMGGNPSLKVAHRGLDACLCATAGDPVGAERRIEEGAELLKTHPRRSSHVEFHRLAGRANLLMGRADRATAELEQSLSLARHPMELHLTRHWLAQAYDLKGDREKAAEMERALAADGIASKFSRASPPAPSEPPRAS